MDGWTVTGGARGFRASDIRESGGATLGYQLKNASYLHNYFFHKERLGDQRRWVFV